HSARSMGAFKLCLYQIIVMSLLSQQFCHGAPIYVLPIIGAYHYVDFTDQPYIIHAMVSGFLLASFLDFESILDGLNYRWRVLLKIHGTKFTHRAYWV
ncbi:hypothetical protein PFISCL1PPCAC_12881, partial [Pristionchus fissidentatus]